MSAAKRLPKFRVGDWVSLLYGPQLVLAQVIEDRGPLGVGGRRLYRIRLDQDQEEPTVLESPAEDLTPTTEADREAWRTERSLATHQTLTYFTKPGDPRPQFHYLVVARPGRETGSATASIISLSEARSTGVAQSPTHTIDVHKGGPDAALAKAEEYLNTRHPELHKVVGEKRP